MCQGLTQSYGGLLAMRFLMGIFEASLPAGSALLISIYYTKKEASLRFAWFFCFALGGSFFSGLLAYAIQHIEGTGGYQGWRWVLIIEGCKDSFFPFAPLSSTPCILSIIHVWIS